MIIYISASDVSVVILLKDVHFGVSETTDKNTKFGMTKINEHYVSCIGCIQIIFPENSIV